MGLIFAFFQSQTPGAKFNSQEWVVMDHRFPEIEFCNLVLLLNAIVCPLLYEERHEYILPGSEVEFQTRSESESKLIRSLVVH